MGIKHCGKRRYCSLLEIPPFPTMFSKDLCSRHIKTGLVWERNNSSPNDKILELSRLKAFTDKKINMAQKLKFVYGKVKIIVGKGYQHFLLFPKCFQ